MKSRVSASPASIVPSAAADDSSARRLVVPMATMRPPRARRRDGRGRLRGNPISLGVHQSRVRSSDSRLKRAGADMERDVRDRDPALVRESSTRRRKSSRRRGRRARMARAV